MIFISYARDDYRDQNNQIIEGNCISKIEKILDKEKLQYWRDERNISPGDEWQRSIENEIKKAQVCLLFVTKNSCVSPYVIMEIHYALLHNVKIIPILTIPDNEVSGLIYFFIAKIQYVDYTKDIENAHTKLIDSIKFTLEIKSYEALLKQCENELSEYDNELTELRERRDKYDAEKRLLIKRHEELEDKITSKEKTIESYEDEMSKIREAKRQKAKEIDYLRKKINKNDGQKTAAIPDDPDNSDPTRFDDVEIKESEETIKGEAPEKENINQENQPESADSAEKSQGVDLKENNTKPNSQISDGMSALESYFKKSQKDN